MHMKSLTLALGICAGSSMLCFSQTASAEEKFKPEVFGVEKAIAPGPNVFVNQASWDGASRIHVYGQEKLDYKGELSLGLTSQITPSKDGSKIFALSTYMKRYTYGPKESALQIFDVKTLSEITEILVPTNAGQVIGMSGIIEKSADEKLVYIQNASPATSITIVDVDHKKVLPELPIPGCYGIFPAQKGEKFSTLCGTGKIKTYTMKKGEFIPSTSKKIFDVDTDALYVHAQRNTSGQLLFTSFNGNIYVVDDSAETPKLVEKIEFAKEIEGNWVPGGYLISAYNGPKDVLFMIMHPDAYEGSHKDASEEIWAYSMKERKLISRSKAQYMTSIVATQDESPVIYGTNEEDESIDKYTLTDTDKFIFTKTASDGRSGWSTSLAVTR